jgi:hypothetical protein
MNETLNPRFLEELFRLCFLKKSIIEKLQTHLAYQHLPSQELKIIYKGITNHFSLTNSLPTFGTIFEQNKNDEKVVAVLKRIKETDICNPEPLLRQLESYLRDVKFQLLWQEVIDIDHKGDSVGAMRLMAERSKEIVEFSMFKDNGNFLRVFQDFQKVALDKQIKKEEQQGGNEKIPFGILPCDIISNGGSDRKETVLWIMRSGVGKSTVLKWHGMYACRLGYDVLHIQLEGASEESFDKYTQIWSALNYHTVKSGSIEGDNYERLLGIAKEMVVLKRDVCIKSFEQFDEASMVDIRDTVVEYIKEFGKPPDLLILDSIDLCHPGDGLKYGVDTQSIKMKLQNCSRKFKNLCNEFDMRGFTATQTSDVKADIWNDPNRVITRSDSMGDKNIANSYSYVFTGNQTYDEEKARTMRVYFDKIRYYNSKSRIFPIATNYEQGRFFDLQRTRKIYKDIYE